MKYFGYRVLQVISLLCFYLIRLLLNTLTTVFEMLAMFNMNV